MKRIQLIILLFLTGCLTVFSQDKSHWYFGQKPPGINIEKFNGGSFFEDENNRKRSFNLTFSPSGDEMFFSYYKGTKNKPHPEYEIKTSKYIDGKWTYPETASFSGEYSDVDINYSPDGKYLFYASDRPQPNSIGLDIYYSVKTFNGWSDPIYAGTDVNTVEGEVYPSVSARGNIFFRSSRSGGYSDSDLYKAEWEHGNFINVQNLGPNVNSPYGQSNAVIAPDESYILLCTLRPDSEKWQIFVSFQMGENNWTKAVSLGPQVNTQAGAGAPTITPDGSYIIFSKRRGPDRGLYWVSTELIEKIKKENIAGEYFGQTPPGKIPEKFAPGILPKNGKFTLGLNIIEDGSEIYYSQWEKTGPQVRCMKMEDGYWTFDSIASFSGEYNDWDLTVSSDGKRLYFSSKRPISQGDTQKNDADIWYVEIKNGSWGEPVHMGFPVNSDSNEVHPTIAENGNLYFFGKHGPNISVCKNVNGTYGEPEKLGEEINSEHVDLDPLVAPDESFLIFHSNRPGGFGKNDLYISYMDEKSGKWGKAINMGKVINTEESDYCARISSDGKYMFFSRRNPETKQSEFYWVDAKVIEDIKQNQHQ